MKKHTEISYLKGIGIIAGVLGPILVRMILKYISKLANEKIFCKIAGGK